jgi:hypothetical protein
MVMFWTVVGTAALIFSGLVKLFTRGWFSGSFGLWIARIYYALTRVVRCD